MSSENIIAICIRKWYYESIERQGHSTFLPGVEAAPLWSVQQYFPVFYFLHDSKRVVLRKVHTRCLAADSATGNSLLHLDRGARVSR